MRCDPPAGGGALGALVTGPSAPSKAQQQNQHQRRLKEPHSERGEQSAHAGGWFPWQWMLLLPCLFGSGERRWQLAEGEVATGSLSSRPRQLPPHMLAVTALTDLGQVTP